MDEYGWIYIINNKERDGDGVFKVGYTSDLKSRLSKLNSETGSYGKFEQIAKFFVTDMEAAERECHTELEDYRKQDNREFFQGNQKEIINIVKNIISNYKPVDELPENNHRLAVRLTAKKVLDKWTAYLKAIAKQGGTVEAKVLNKFDKLYGIAFAEDADPTKKPVANAMADIHTLMIDLGVVSKKTKTKATQK
ncbi:uncharacterized protein METZ01_LOCUS389811 [marine metagenome]|uniref:Bacteriophage T5 Orf172 DNA-binding domain-containing protein n=1 Tax=marine metagenome TaxID=408172 RepID=A0A382US36_9ZZZZ